MTTGTRIDARDPAVVRLLEQLRDAGLVDYGFVAGSGEVWVEVSPDLMAFVEASCDSLLVPAFGMSGSHLAHEEEA